MPTTGELFEGGIKYQPVGINALVTASVFQITKNNVSTTDPNNTLFSVQTGQVRSRGFEIEGQLSLANGLNALGSFSYTDVLVTQSNGIDLGKVPVGVPAYQAAAFLDYTQQRGRLAGLGGGAGIRYIGETWADTGNTFKNSGTTAVDLTLHYDFEKFGLAVVARNVFDQEVPICNSGNCTLSQGRTLLGTLTARW
jgi:iron complex outermembrane receptor protein